MLLFDRRLLVVGVRVIFGALLVGLVLPKRIVAGSGSVWGDGINRPRPVAFESAPQSTVLTVALQKVSEAEQHFMTLTHA